MKTLTPVQAAGILFHLKEHADNVFFSVTFIRRTDSRDGLRPQGTETQLTARFGVKSHLKGGSLAYNPDDYNLIIAYKVTTSNPCAPVDKRGYRAIPWDSITQLRVFGQQYRVAA